MNANAPAFPFQHEEGPLEDRSLVSTEGLTKREYIAARVLHGMASIGPWDGPDTYPEMARRSVALADALLAALESP